MPCGQLSSCRCRSISTSAASVTSASARLIRASLASRTYPAWTVMFRSASTACPVRKPGRICWSVRPRIDQWLSAALRWHQPASSVARQDRHPHCPTPLE
jgi:hypothetical protein